MVEGLGGAGGLDPIVPGDDFRGSAIHIAADVGSGPLTKIDCSVH